MTRSIPKLQPSLFDELVIDNFAGGGGASLGMEQGLGRAVDIAINHDREAVEMHKVNHPNTTHYCEDVWSIDPVNVCKGRPVGLAWFSPDCKHFSKAKGGKPVSRKIRGLAWVVVRWAQKVRPRVIMLENVEEFRGWGPLVPVCDSHGREKTGPDGKAVMKPCGVNEGATFYRWVSRLKKLGYKVDWRELRACDYGAPTIRKRLFLIARCDGMPIVWPEPTHGYPKSEAVQKGKLQPWRTAAECIDWSIPAPSIFERNRQLADNTLKRIARGIRRFVLESSDPFLVNLTHGGRVEDCSEPFKTITGANRGEKAIVVPILTECANSSSSRNMPVNEPLRTVTAWPKGGSFAVVSPTLIQIGYGERPGQEPRAPGLEKPLGTVVAGGVKHALVSAHIQRQFGTGIGSNICHPLGTVTAGGMGKSALVTAHVQQQFGRSIGSATENPLGTVTTKSKSALIAASLVKHYGGNYDGPGADLREPVPTVTTKDHSGLVASHLIKLRGTCKDGQSLHDPMPTVTAGGQHVGEVRAFLIKYYGRAVGQDIADPLHTVTANDKMALVSINNFSPPLTEHQRYGAWWVARLLEEYGENCKDTAYGPRPSAIVAHGGVIVDIGMRMLVPRELYRAQGFPDEYIIDPVVDGKPLTKTAEVRMCGNSVSPVIPRAMVAANITIRRCTNVIQRHS